jgi:hypothetical protein
MINNESIIEKLSIKIWNQMKYYVSKGYIHKKVYIKPKNKFLLFDKNFIKMESWDIFSQRNNEIVLFINNEILKESGLQLKCIDLGWEIFNNNKIFYTFTFRINIIPKIVTTEEEQVSQTTNLTEKTPSIASLPAVLTYVPDERKRQQSSSSRFVVSQKDNK